MEGRLVDGRPVATSKDDAMARNRTLVTGKGQAGQYCKADRKLVQFSWVWLRAVSRNLRRYRQGRTSINSQLGVRGGNRVRELDQLRSSPLALVKYRAWPDSYQ